MAVFLTPNLGVSTVLSSSFYAIFNLFAGFAINPPSIPGWWIWVSPFNECLVYLPFDAGQSQLATKLQL